MPKRRNPRKRNVAHRATGKQPAARRFPVELRESAATIERTELRESVARAIADAPADSAAGLLIDMQILEAGWNKAGTKWYGPELLVRDVPVAFPAGTHVHLDHPAMSDEIERPERSLQTLAAVLAETPYSPDNGKTARAKVRVFSHYAPFIREAWQHIGVSINADGTGSYGERDGRKGLIVESISQGKSVDFVTKAGAGGRIVSLLESARETALREARSFGGWLESRLHLTLTQFADDAYGDGRLTRAERITLSQAIGDGLTAWTARVEADAPQLFQRDIWAQPETVDAQESLRLRETTADQIRTALDQAVRVAYGDGDNWCWVRDYDPDKSLVWFEAGSDGDAGTWQQKYTTDGKDAVVTAALTGERSKVVAQTVYTPVETGSGGATDADLTEAATQPATAPVPLREATTTTTDVTDGTAPAAPQKSEEVPVSGTNTGPAPGTAGTPASAPATETVDVKAREADEARIKAESERDVALREAEESKRELARFRAVEAARPIAEATVAEGNELAAGVRAYIVTEQLKDVPLTEAHVLDEQVLKDRVAAHVETLRVALAESAEADGAGKVRGVGTAPTGEQSADNKFAPSGAPQVNTALVESYMARGMTREAATLAAVGRPF